MKNKIIIFLLLITASNLLFADYTISLLPANSKRLQQTAQIFAKTLNKMTGQQVDIVTANSPTILLALAKNYKGEVKIPVKFANHREAFTIAASNNSIIIIGNSDTAIRNGIYTYLKKLGCRWFFPGKKWTIIPKRKNIFIDYKYSSAPDYSNRNIWYQYGFGWGKRWNAKKIKEDYLLWHTANLQGGKDAKCGHAWGSIARRNKDTLKKHPEYYAMGKDGKRIIPKKFPQAQFCCSNPDLIKLVAEDRLKLLRQRKQKDPNAFMVSVDPSDLAYMCYCPECKKLGGGKPSDMVLNLANGVAKYLRKKEPGAWVGLYAYSAHLDPPSLPIEKNVYVQIATAFNKTNYSTDELIKIWGEKAGAIGIREYFSCMAWNFSLPGKARVSDINYLKTNIPKWYKWGASSISAESNNSWIPQGLGYYIAANLMWDTKCDVKALEHDFYKKAFGKAAKPMQELYTSLMKAHPLLPTYLKNWFNKVVAAEKLTKDPDVLNRLNDFKAYLHYLLLYYEFKNAQDGNDAREKYLALLEFAFRIKSRNIIHSYALARRMANGRFPASVMSDLPKALKGKNKREIAKWNIFKYKTCPWQQNTTEYSNTAIDKIFKDDLTQIQKFKTNIKVFSYNLIVPPVPLKAAGTGKCKMNSYRFNSHFYFIAPANKTIKIKMVGIRMSKYSIFRVSDNKEIQSKTVHKKEQVDIVVKSDKTELYKLVADSLFKLIFPDDLKVVYEKSANSKCQPTPYAGPGYFFVPKGTKKFTMAVGTRLIIKDPNGKVYKYLKKSSPKTVTIKVPKNCDGQLWELKFLTCGNWYFFDLPPFVSLTPNGYIGPSECFENLTNQK